MQDLAPSASARITSWPERMPPSNMISICVPTASTISGKASIEDGHFSTSLCHLGTISYRVGRSVTFDGATERFVGDEAADKLLTRAYRAPYVLPGKT